MKKPFVLKWNVSWMLHQKNKKLLCFWGDSVLPLPAHRSGRPLRGNPNSAIYQMEDIETVSWFCLQHMDDLVVVVQCLSALLRQFHQTIFVLWKAFIVPSEHSRVGRFKAPVKKDASSIRLNLPGNLCSEFKSRTFEAIGWTEGCISISAPKFWNEARTKKVSANK